MKKPRNRKKRPMFGPLVALFPHRRDMGMIAGAAHGCIDLFYGGGRFASSATAGDFSRAADRRWAVGRLRRFIVWAHPAGVFGLCGGNVGRRGAQRCVGAAVLRPGRPDVALSGAPGLRSAVPRGGAFAPALQKPEVFHDLEHDDAARKPSRDGGQDQGGGDVGMAGQFRYKSVARGLGAYRAEYKSTARKRSKRSFWPERKLGVK
jgi:hypothetical protein